MFIYLLCIYLLTGAVYCDSLAELLEHGLRFLLQRLHLLRSLCQSPLIHRESLLQLCEGGKKNMTVNTLQL